MTNTSASGGYLVPSLSNDTPGGLTLTQFIQLMIVGVSGFADPTLVRPRWQMDEPKQPDVTVDWIAYGISTTKADAYASVFQNGDGTSSLNRQEQLAIQVAFYGPNALDNYSIFRDSLHNGASLRSEHRHCLFGRQRYSFL